MKTKRLSQFLPGRKCVQFAGALGILWAIQQASTPNLLARDDSDSYRTIPVDQLVDSSVAPGAKRVNDLKAEALTREADDAAQQLKEVEAKVKEHNQAMDEQKRKVAEHKARLEAHDRETDSFNNSITVHNRWRDDLANRIAASNALQPQQRNQATVNALNAELGRLKQEASSLSAQGRRLNNEAAQIDNERDVLNQHARELNEEGRTLNEKHKLLEARLRKAWTQLKECGKYAQDLRARFGSAASNYQAPQFGSGTAERLKELSGEGFDGNTDKPELTPDKIKPPFHAEQN